MNMTLQRFGLGAIGGNASTLGDARWHFGACRNDGAAMPAFLLRYFFCDKYFGVVIGA